MSGIVTPEAVVLNFDEAGLGSRIGAQVIDITIRGLLSLLFFFVSYIFENLGGPGWVAVTVAIFGVFFVIVIYPILFESLWSGKTPGKAAFGLRVVTVEGGPIHFRHALVRGFIGIFETYATSGVVAAIFIFATKRHQRLGDLAAGTLVMRERQAQKMPTSVSFAPPPGAEDFAQTLDVSALTNDDYVTIRAFLLRATGLESKARLDLANDLGRRYVEKLRSSPPPWMAAEMYLVCVVAVYQRRYAAT